MCNLSPITKNVLKIDFSNVHAHYVAWHRDCAPSCFLAEIHQVIGVPIKLPCHRVQDIDTPEDWTRAEWMFKAMQASKGNQ